MAGSVERGWSDRATVALVGHPRFSELMMRNLHLPPSYYEKEYFFIGALRLRLRSSFMIFTDVFDLLQLFLLHVFLTFVSNSYVQIHVIIRFVTSRNAIGGRRSQNK